MSYSTNEMLQYGVSQAQESLTFASTPYVWVCRRIHTFVRSCIEVGRVISILSITADLVRHAFNLFLLFLREN